MEPKGITIPVSIGISRETVDRCLRILSMYLTDHPDVGLTVDEYPAFDTFIREANLTGGDKNGF